MRPALLLALLLVCPAAASGQVDGSASLMFDVFPDIGEAEGNQSVSEFRAHIFAERRFQVGEHLRLLLSGYADGLIGDRDALGATETVRDVVVRPTDLYAEFAASRFDVRIGASRLVWGKLDEFQPTDVVNPLDLAKFLLEGRSEARLAVAVVRGRVFLPGSSTLEGVVVPWFRAGEFDQLDEPTSPFNLTNASDVGAAVPNVGAAFRRPITRNEPALTWSNVQGGARFTSTVRRVDWSVSGYRGFRTFPIVSATARAVPDGSGQSLALEESFPRFTMLGGDFETVRGEWGFRGELAFFIDDVLQSTRAVRGVPGRSIQGGVGVDRRAGDYRLAGDVLWSSQSVDTSDPVGRLLDGEPELERSNLSLVAAADRSFARETRTLRLFAVYDPKQDTGFVRVIGAVSVHDNVWVEGSGGLFAGSSLDLVGRLTRRDFVYARLKVYF